MEEQLRQPNDDLEARVTERTEELTESQKRLRVLAAELTVTEQRERQRLAVDLMTISRSSWHLIRIKLSLAKQQPMQPPLAKIITDMDEVTSKAMTYTRTLISQLCPPALSESGLPMALQWLTEQMQEHNLSSRYRSRRRFRRYQRIKHCCCFNRSVSCCSIASNMPRRMRRQLRSNRLTDRCTSKFPTTAQVLILWCPQARKHIRRLRVWTLQYTRADVGVRRPVRAGVFARERHDGDACAATA